MNYIKKEPLCAWLKNMGISDFIIQRIKSEIYFPTPDVAEVKYGEWATNEEDIKWGNALKRKHCSVCQKRPLFDKEKKEFILTKFCPNCGAKMDGWM